MDVVADAHVVCHADLATHADTLADANRSRETGLSGHESLIANLHVVPDVHVGIELDSPTEASRTESSRIDGAVRSHLDVVAQRDAPTLGNAADRTFGAECPTEPRPSDDAVRPEHQPRTGTDAAVHDRMRTDDGVAADLDVSVDDGPRSNPSSGPDSRPRRDPWCGGAILDGGFRSGREQSGNRVPRVRMHPSPTGGKARRKAELTQEHPRSASSAIEHPRRSHHGKVRLVPCILGRDHPKNASIADFSVDLPPVLGSQSGRSLGMGNVDADGQGRLGVGAPGTGIGVGSLLGAFLLPLFGSGAGASPRLYI